LHRSAAAASVNRVDRMAFSIPMGVIWVTLIEMSDESAP